jgi:DNA-directed RNA polymerase specialized sigma24 family protein
MSSNGSGSALPEAGRNRPYCHIFQIPCTTHTMKDWNLTKDHFDKLLAWLDADRDRAGEKYEYIRHSLIKIFGWQGCHHTEELADETINRVMRKIDQISGTYEGDPARYFQGVARMVLFEFRRKKLKLASSHMGIEAAVSEPKDAPDKDDLKFNCLDLCLQQLSKDNRDLILRYYQEEKQAKIDFRKVLADQMEITAGALRVRVHRIRDLLYECISKCLEKPGRG